ncbi:MAG TPA: tetratricopeptide repeat protein [Gemmatimonadaceae bacterium]
MFGEHMQDLLGQTTESTEEPPRELTVEEVLEIAIHLHQRDQLAEAEVVYRRILAVEPEHSRALHFAGILAHQLGRSSDGIALIEKSLALGPENADWYSNFGIVLQESGRVNAAIGAYQRAIELDRTHAIAYSNVGVLLRATGKPEDAEAAYRKAIELKPDHPDAYTNLGVLLNTLKRTDEAVACFCKAITLRPKHPEARRLLALAHCTLGDVDEAVRIFEEWLAEEPDDPIAQHMLSACTGRDIPSRASDGFVERTFDSFAASFESKLAKLSYRAPALVSAMLDDAGVEASRSLDVLDAGCGTGLCGPLVAPYARRLTGIDLSAGMLAQAREKQVYDELLQGELTAYLRDHSDAFDIIVSADTLVYFGALDAVIAAAARALRAGGLLIFTLEHGAGESAPDYHLELHGRYTHAQPYVERLLVRSGFEPEIGHAELRMESGVPVQGLVVRARKVRSGGRSE